MVQFIIKNRLQWVSASTGKIDTTPRTTEEVFTDEQDAKIITNDFPYNFSDDITHLVAWTKLDIKSDPQSEIGDLTDRTRAVIDRYVVKTFVEWLGINRENVVWFRNFPALQSVLELSHIHILIRGLEKGKLEEVLGSPGKVLTKEDLEEIYQKF